jgi:hypothetical protein
MTNEQLAILIKNYQLQLIEAQSNIRAELPDSLLACKKNFLGQEICEFKQLDTLQAIIDNMQSDIEKLEKQTA